MSLPIEVINRKLLQYNKITFYIFLLLLFLLLSIFFKNNLAGDSLIHLIYGINLANGNFLQFNLGEISFGSSSIIWSVISSIPYILNMDNNTAIYFQKGLSLSVSFLCVIWLKYSKFFKLNNIEYIILVSFWFGLTKFLQFSTVGMETALAMFLVLLVTDNAFKLFNCIYSTVMQKDKLKDIYWKDNLTIIKNFLIGGTYSGLLILTRFELTAIVGIILICLLASIYYWRKVFLSIYDQRDQASPFFPLLLVGIFTLAIIITITPYLIYVYEMNGSFISNSGGSRLYLAQSQVNSAIHLLGNFYLNIKLLAFIFSNSLLFIAAAIGTYYFYREAKPQFKSKSYNHLLSREFSIIVCVLSIITIGCYFMFIFPGFQGGRYFMPIMGLIVVLASKGTVIFSLILAKKFLISSKSVVVFFVGLSLATHGLFNYNFTPIPNLKPSQVSFEDLGNFINSNITKGKSILLYEVQVKLHLPYHRIIAEDGATDGLILKYYKKYPNSNEEAVEHFLLIEKPDYVFSGMPRHGLTPRVKNTLLGKLQTLAERSQRGQEIWLSDRISATEIFSFPSSQTNAETTFVEKLYKLNYR